MFKSVAGLVLLTVLSAQAQPPAQKKTARGLSVDSILSMVQAGISESVIVARIRRESQGLDVSPEDLVRLKRAGATDAILHVLLDPKADIVLSAPTGAPASGPSPPASVAPLAPATAAPAVVPSEIGVYVKKDGGWSEILPEVVNWKSGGVLKSVATVGVVKGDVNGNIQGLNSKNSVKAPPEFLVVTPEGIAITEYQLLKLRPAKDVREFRTVTGGVFHAKTGATRDLMPFDHRKAGNRAYEIIFTGGIGPGEYGFLPPSGFGSASNSAAGRMYTFRLGQ